MFTIKPKVVEPKLPIEAQRMIQDMKTLGSTEAYNYNTGSLLNKYGKDTYHRVNKIQDDITQQKLQEEAEAAKQANMNPVHRALYKTVQKPITQWWGKVKPQEKELPPLRENWNRGVNLFND